MRLTKGTDIALRIAMRLAVAGDEEAPTTREVAGAVGVPYTHAAKVVSRLQHLGVVEARRGRGGGLTLTAAGRTASIGRLVREPDTASARVPWSSTEIVTPHDTDARFAHHP
ncbi:RrF2 family transcriptional regulator, partial [Streptomyces sp. NPDC002537]